MRYINSFIGLFLIMMLVTACGERQDQQQDEFGDQTQPGDEPTQTQPPAGDDQSPPAGGEQDQTETQMGEEPQQEFVDQMEMRLNQAEEELDQVRQNDEALGEEQEQGNQQVDQIEERIDNTRDQLSELEDTESENWEQQSQQVMNNINDIEEDIQSLRGGGGQS